MQNNRDRAAAITRKITQVLCQTPNEAELHRIRNLIMARSASMRAISRAKLTMRY